MNMILAHMYLLAITYKQPHVDVEPYTQAELCRVVHKDITKRGYSAKVFDARCSGIISVEPEPQAVYGEGAVVYE